MAINNTFQDDIKFNTSLIVVKDDNIHSLKDETSDNEDMEWVFEVTL